MDEKNLFEKFFSPFLGIENITLNERSRHLAWSVYSIAVNEIQETLEESKDNILQNIKEKSSDDLKFDVESEALKSELKEIVELFQGVDKAREEFLEHFTSWNNLRLTLIQQLREIPSSFHYALNDWDIGKIIGTTLKISGGIAVFGTIIFPPATLMLMPVAAGGLAGAAALLTLRAGMGKNYALQNAQKDRDKDLECLHCLELWFESAEKLLKPFTTLIGIQTLKIILKDWKTFMHQFKYLEDTGWLMPMLKQWVRDVNSCWILQPKFGPHLSPIVTTFLFVTLYLQEENIFLLECISKTSQFITKQSTVSVDLKTMDTERKNIPRFRKICDDLNSSNLATVAQKLSNERYFLENVYNILKITVEEGSVFVDDFVPLNADSEESSKKCSDEPSPIEESSKRSVVMIFNVPCNVEKDEVISAVEFFLPSKARGSVEFLKTMSGIMGNHWVLEIDEDNLSQLLKQKRIKVGCIACPIDKYRGIYRCSKCQRFGHNASLCKSKAACSKCASDHEEIVGCASNEIMCINCIRFNENNNTDYNTNHTVDARRCSTYSNLKEHLRSGKTFQSWVKIAG